MKKNVLAILTASVILVSFLAAALLPRTVVAADPEDWYMTVNGVLSSDYYSLYPFATGKSLKIGFSKYGELVNDVNNVGLEYGAVDPFAAPAGSGIGSIPKVLWIQGWLINISYFNIPQSKYRNVWAYAAFSDASAFGGSWIRVDFADDWSATYGWEDPRDPGYIIGNYGAGPTFNGGRKTNGTAVTEPIQVLYNGPRLFVALLNTTVYDHPVFLSDSTANDIPLVRVLITIIFNKVKKEVVLLKDVKSLLTEKTGVNMNIQFSNRGEVDLGTEAAGYHSRFHFFTQGTALNDSLSEGQPTVYDRSWTICSTVDLGVDSAIGGMPQVGTATFDVAQAINAGYVWWAAFWPSLSDWTIDGWGTHWRSMMENDPHWIDGDPAKGGEPRIPFYIGEWDFRLWAKEYALTNPIEFRGVTVYGVTDLNDGDDQTRKIDIEVLYQLDEVFNPWSLVDAVHKDTKRWVQFYTVTEEDEYWAGYGFPLVIWLDQSPVLYAPVWEEYCSFSERVLWGGKLRRPERAVGTAYDYELVVFDDGTGYILIPAAKVPAAGTEIKILYSTDTSYWEDDVLTFVFEEIDSDGWLFDYDSETWTDYLGAGHELGLDGIDIYVTFMNRTEDWTASFDFEDEGWAYDFKVFKGDTAEIWWDHEEPVYDGNENVSITLNYWPYWFITSPDLMDLHVYEAYWIMDIYVDLSYNATEDELNITATVDFNYYYSESIPGRYEWVTVGRDAHSADSIGASLVSAAFKNKQVEIGNAGFDMMFQEYALTSIPYLLHKFSGTGTGWPPNYKDSIYRIALRDDWCHTWPVSSSNIIGVGGPLANHISEYFNDFTSALFGLNTVEAPFTPYAPWVNKIIALTCWNKNTYSSSANVGYAVIATYKDINGTVGFLVWGISARDTFYASKFFHDEIIYELQGFPRGATSIVIKIDYTDPEHPTFTIPEVLGTISEMNVERVKGGIHPDP